MSSVTVPAASAYASSARQPGRDSGGLIREPAIRAHNVVHWRNKATRVGRTAEGKPVSREKYALRGTSGSCKMAGHSLPAW